MRHVEFLGPPGSGKSTLAAEVTANMAGVISLEEAVRRAIRDQGSDGMTRMAARLSRSARSRLWRTAYGRSSDRTAAMARFDAEHPDAMKAVVEAQKARAGRDRGQDLVLGWMTNLMARYQLVAEAGETDRVVIDEGFTQRAVALFGYGFAAEDEPLLSRYLAAVPTADLLVAVQTPLDVCANRLDTRGWSERVSGLHAEQRIRFLETSARVVGVVTEWTQGRGGRVVFVDGTAAAPDAFRVVAEALGGPASSPEPSRDGHG